MAYIKVKDLQDFTGVIPEEGDTLQSIYINSAKSIIDNYLNYDAELKTYNGVFDGNGTDKIFLKAKPIEILQSVKIDDKEIDIANFVFDDYTEILYATNGIVFNKGTRNIIIKYSAGFNEIPEIIKLTNLRIAGILQTEGNNNIGISSKSFGTTESRVFINTVNFDKYLLPLSKYKLL